VGRRIIGAVLGLLVIVLAPTGSMRAAGYAPVDRPGPVLSVPAAGLEQSLHCTANVVTAGREVVVLVPPTLVTPHEAWFAYERAFDAMGLPYCEVEVPHFTTQDIQVNAEYTVYAVRRAHDLSGRRVQILGWSQSGGPEPRWALRFWPDIRPMVDDVVGIAGTSHGTPMIAAFCNGPCIPALRQQWDISAFTRALNSGQETFAGIDYTEIYSHTDQFVQPDLDSSGTSSLHGPGRITDVATQDICPGNVADHLAFYYDPVAYALAIDALTHDGPAVPARIDRALCAQATMPYIRPNDVPLYSASLVQNIFVTRLNTEPRTTNEPPLRDYVTR
jgi:hypothetical protein